MESDIKSMADIFKKNPYLEHLQKLKEFSEKNGQKINPIHEVVNTYYKLMNLDGKPKKFYEGRYSYGRLAAQAKNLLLSCNQDLEDALWCLDKMKYLADKGGFDWTISTCLKHELRWGISNKKTEKKK